MCRRILTLIASLLVLCCSQGSVSAQLLEISWTGGGDGMTWEDPDNWDPAIVPDDPDHVAVFDSVTASIDVGPDITLFGVCFINSDNLEMLGGGFEFVGFGFNSDPEVKIDNSTVTVDSPTVINTGVGDDTFTFDLSSTQQFGFTNVTFSQPITTNDNNIVIVIEETDSALLRFDLDFDGGNTGDFIVDGTASVGVFDDLTASDVTVINGDISLVNLESQLIADTLSLDGGSLSLDGQANPLPNLNSPIHSRGGRISNFGDGTVTVSNSLHVDEGMTALEVRFFKTGSTLDFNGLLERERHSTVGINVDLDGHLFFNGAQGADANGVLPYAVYNDDDFAAIILATGEVVRLTSYTPITTASPGDAAEAVGNVTLTSDVDVSVSKINNASVDGNGNSITNDALLVQGVNASISNTTLRPHDQTGTDPNELIIHAPTGADRLNLTNVNIIDNNDPTALTISGPKGGRVTINDALSKTGDTSITSGTVTLVSASANLGGDNVKLSPGASLILSNNHITQDITLDAGLFGPTIAADVESIISGNITINNNSANDRAVTLTAVQSDDFLTINSTVTRGGAGNPIAGQGRAILELGLDFGRGKITANIDSSDPGVLTKISGADGREINFPAHNAIYDLIYEGSTTVTGNFTVSNDFQIEAFPFASGAETMTLSAGDSLGTATVGNDATFGGASFTYEVEVDDAGGSDLLAVGGTLTLGAATNALDIRYFSGSSLAGDDYTLATYGSLVGVFDTVMFDGAIVVDPTSAGAIGGTHRLAYGVNALMLTMAASFQADFDNDGDVDGDDFLTWQSAFGTNANGDADNDGDTDGDDFLIWQSEFGSGTGSTTSAAPEPSGWLLLCLAAFVVAVSRRQCDRSRIAKVTPERMSFSLSME